MSLPVWRSQLFIPATAEKFIARGPEVGADALILDLEDSVAASAKESARAAAPDIVRGFRARGIDTLVRINRPWRLAVRDLEAAVIPELTALLCPMVDSAEHVVALSGTIAGLEAERGIPAGRIRLCLAVETAKGYLNLREIARADPRSVALSLGSEDFSLSMGMVADEETLYGPKQQVVACAREAGLLPMGFVGSIADYRDVDAFRRIVRRSKKMGLKGATCIHPNQVRVCNEEFGPTEAETEEARRIVAAYDGALARGEGAISVDGRMVDVPVAERAREVLRIADAVAARQRGAGAAVRRGGAGDPSGTR